MTLTLLLDLDDTLLINPIDAFLASYLKAFGKHLNGIIDPNLFIQKLLAATQVMLQNDRPESTLEQTFDHAFYPSIGVTKNTLQQLIDSFYSEVFPTLQSITWPRPAAVEMVKQAFQRGYRVVVATNPLFPKTAILQRLEWAGLSPDQFPFDLITSYETFHFAKPNPTYFLEILAQLGWPAEPAIMVGNSLKDDILPAARAGLLTYYLDEGDAISASKTDIPGAYGSLNDLMDWLETVNPETDLINNDQPETQINILKSTPAALSSIAKNLPAEQWTIRPEPGEWSLTEIACHLRDVEKDVNLTRLGLIQNEANPFLPGWDTDIWADERGYINQNGSQALADFITSRLKTLAVLDTFTQDVWEKSTRHAIFGPTTVKELVSFITSHDQTHIKQFVDTIPAVHQPISQ